MFLLSRAIFSRCAKTRRGAFSILQVTFSYSCWCLLFFSMQVMGLPMHRTSRAIGDVIQKIRSSGTTDDEDGYIVEKDDLSAPPSTGTTSKSGAWQERFQQLMKFQQAHGHCLVPKRYSSNKALANWVSKQRQEYRRHQQGEKTALSHERIAALNEVGFCWNAQGQSEKSLSTAKCLGSEVRWHSHWEELRDFMVENSLRSVAEIPKYSDHKSWIRKQRRNYLEDQNRPQKSLSEDQIALLNSLDPHWHLNRHEVVWEQRFNELMEYAKQNGDCCVPISYSNRKLAHWVSNQRKFYTEQTKGKQNSLDDQRKQRLEKIGFVWNRWDYEFSTKNAV